MAERVDVCIVGSGFGGAISAFRLAELYRAAGERPSILVLERGRRYEPADFRQSADINHLSSVYNLIQGQGAQIATASLVGGGSNLYLAASLRAPRETFERRDRRPGDGPDRRMWPKEISRRTLNPFYRRAERGLRVDHPPWDDVTKAGGLWAATLNAAGHTCDRVPVAINRSRCVETRWCWTGCIFAAKNSLITNYLPSAEEMGVELRPNSQVELVRQSQARPYRYIVRASGMDNEGTQPTRQPSGESFEVECKVLILAAGAMATPPLLMRSRPFLPGLSDRLGKHLGVNGDHMAAVEYDERKVRSVLGLPGYGQFYKGKAISTMTYDFWVGRRSNQFDGTRFNLQEITLGALSNFLYDDGREPGGEPSWWGLQKKRSISAWNNRLEVLAMVEDTHDGEFYAAPPSGGHLRPSPGAVGIGLFRYAFSEQSVRVREAANAAIKRIVERRGLGRFLPVTETQGAYASHPLGGCRMADSKDLGVTDHACEVFGYEGLFCIDSSVIPTSLGVNPSLTIAAVAERAAEKLTERADGYGLPKRPAAFAPQVPGESLGRVKKRSRRRPVPRPVT